MKTTIFKQTGFLIISVIIAFFIISGTCIPDIKAQLRSRHTPGWLKSEPLIIVGNWDSMPIFQVRRGGSPAWQDEMYKKEVEKFVKKMKNGEMTDEDMKNMREALKQAAEKTSDERMKRGLEQLEKSMDKTSTAPSRLVT